METPSFACLGQSPALDGLPLFKEMMHCLGHFLNGPLKPSIIQTFLSGTLGGRTTGNVRNRLESAFILDWKRDHGYKFFELIIARYEVFHTHTLVDSGAEAMTLDEIYPGAIVNAETLGRAIKLKELRLVEADYRFPEMRG
ncbi:hypothetical protein BGX26_008917 [Mortierella sp. AD094]|nr:hypothetical protein BGX26_008917 [Mortierella sp. AD094]